MPALIPLWKKMSALPGGKIVFSRMVCLKAPYFRTIRPLVMRLDEDVCEVRIGNRRAVHNHIGTVHAIAMCNMAELAGGLLTDAAVPARTHRWIPKGMTVEYLKKAETDLRAVARFVGPALPTSAAEVPVEVEVYDTREQLVFRARIAMWVTAKK